MIRSSGIGALRLGNSGNGSDVATFITAGTTQTQAGATAITSPVVGVTTGNANDGVILPEGVVGADGGEGILVKNLSAAILKVYPYSTGNVNNAAAAGTASAAFSQAASTTYIYFLTGANVWKGFLLS